MSIGRRSKYVMVLAILVAALSFTQTTFANNGATLTIATTSDPAGQTGFFYWGDFGQFTQDDGQTRSGTVAAGTVNVYQSLPAGYALDIDCGDATATVIDNGKGVAIEVGSDDITCTFNNKEVGGNITIVNETTTEDDYFYYGDLGTFYLNNSSRSSEDRLPGEYTIFQGLQAGQALNVSCTGGDFTPLAEGVTVTLPENGDVVCTFNNADVGGSITVINASDEGAFTYYGAFGIFDLSNGESMTREDLQADTYTIAQSLESGYELDITCDSANASVVQNGEAIEINLGVSEDVTCTFTNNNIGGSITVVAAGDIADDFIYYGSFGIVTGTAGTSIERTGLFPNDYEIFQSIPAGYEVAIDCTGGDFVVSDNGEGVTVSLDANEDVVCTFNNTDVGGSIQIMTTGDADSEPFTFYGAFGIVTGTTGMMVERDNLYPGSYDIFQSLPAGFEVSVACEGGDFTESAEQLGGTINLAAGQDIICTFDNTDVGGSITIIAETLPAGFEGLTYYGSFAFNLNDGDRASFDNLYPGDFEIFQDIPEDYTLEISCEGATNTPSADGKGVTISLAAQEDAVCTFTTAVDSLILNGDFEEGRGVAWEEHSSNGFELVVENGAYGSSYTAEDGNWFSWLGGARREWSHLWQSVDLPADQATELAFSYRIDSVDWCGYDWGVVYIHDGQYWYRMWVASLCASNSSDEWQTATVDLSAFAGKEVNILFSAKNDWAYRSSMFVDNVTVKATASTARSTNNEVPTIIGDFIDNNILESDIAGIGGGQSLPERPENDNAEERVSVPTAVTLSNTGSETAPATLPIVLLALAALTIGTAKLNARID